MFNRVFGSWKSSLVGVLVLVLCAGLLWFDKITPLQSAIGSIGILLFFFNDEAFKRILDKFLKK